MNVVGGTTQDVLRMACELVKPHGTYQGWDDDRGILLARPHGSSVTVEIDLTNPVWQSDHQSQVEYIDELFAPARPPTCRWTPYLNHAVLVRASGEEVPIHDVRVDFISPSAKYVRFVHLSQPGAFWCSVDSHDLLEDLGERVTGPRQKQVAG